MVNWRWYVGPGLSGENLWCRGDVVSDGERIKVVRFQLDGRTYYRKESCNERFGRLLDRIFGGGQWCSVPEQEARTLGQLVTEGFRVVPVVAAGSVFRFGIPVKGVMVTEGLDFPLLEDVLGIDCELWRRYGYLVGRLHACGFFDDCRAKDLLLDDGELVLLDREKSRTGNSWNYRTALKSLRRTLYRNQRSGIRANEQADMAFWQGYSKGARLQEGQWKLLRERVSFSSGYGGR